LVAIKKQIYSSKLHEAKPTTKVVVSSNWKVIFASKII